MDHLVKLKNPLDDSQLLPATIVFLLKHVRFVDAFIFQKPGKCEIIAISGKRWKYMAMYEYLKSIRE